MLKRLFVAVLTLVLSLSLRPGGCDSDLEAIRQTALDYADGWYEGDADRVERTLHPDCVKHVLTHCPLSDKTKIEHLGALKLVGGVRTAPDTGFPPDEQRAEVTVLDACGSVASVLLEMDDRIEYMHLVKTDKRWLIIDVLQESSFAKKEQHGVHGDL